MPDYQPNMVLSTQEFNVVGTRPIRHDGPDKVMGRARYAADIHLTGMLHGKILRSPHPHARIRGIDARRALALPGVMAVVTAADFPEVSAEAADLARRGQCELRLLQPQCDGPGKGPLPRPRHRRHRRRQSPLGRGSLGPDRRGLRSPGRPSSTRTRPCNRTPPCSTSAWLRWTARPCAPAVGATGRSR